MCEFRALCLLMQKMIFQLQRTFRALVKAHEAIVHMQCNDPLAANRSAHECRAHGRVDTAADQHLRKEGGGFVDRLE